MGEEIRVGRPVASGPRYEDSARGTHGSSKLPWIILALLAAIVVVGAVLLKDKLFGTSAETATTAESSGYQAVFLTNGQVYFGKLSGITGKDVTLTDIYYLQVKQAVQGSTEQGQAPQQQQSKLELVKLGRELHGPVDTMHINKEHILFYEDMKADSQVYQAIKKHKEDPNSSQQQTTPPATQQRTTPPATQTPPSTLTPPTPSSGTGR